MDVPEPARPTANQPGHPRPGIAAGAREPGLGIPQGARRTVPARSPHQRGDGAADPARPAAQAGPTERGHLLAGVPAHSDRWPIGLRFLPCRHDLPQAPVRAVRHGGEDPASPRPGRDRPPGRRVDRPAGPQPAHGSRRTGIPGQVHDPRPGIELHRRVRRGPRRRRDPDRAMPRWPRTG